MSLSVKFNLLLFGLLLYHDEPTPVKMQTVKTTTVPSTSEKEERKTSPDNTSQYILLGVGLGVFLVVIAVALWYWRVKSKKEEVSVRNNYEQEGVENQSILEITCPPVDRSKKPRKKSKPGELHYADLEDLRTSDRASDPPFPARKPLPYGNTEYAVIKDVIREGTRGVQTAAANSYEDIV